MLQYVKRKYICFTKTLLVQKCEAHHCDLGSPLILMISCLVHMINSSDIR